MPTGPTPTQALAHRAEMSRKAQSEPSTHKLKAVRSYSEGVRKLRLSEIAPFPDDPMPAIILAGYRELVRDLGGDSSDLLRQAGINIRLLDHVEVDIPFSAVATLLEKSAETLLCSDFGMRLAVRQDPLRSFRPLCRLIANAPTLFDSLTWTVSHGQACTSAVRASIVYHPDSHLCALHAHFPNDDLPVSRQFVEMTLLLTQKAIVLLSGGLVSAREIWFSHPPISSSATYRQRFGAAVKFGKDFNAALLTYNDINVRLINTNRDIFLSESRAILARFRAAPEDFDTRVRGAVKSLLFEGMSSQEDVARHLQTSLRTLHRRLHAKGKSFEALRDEVRRNLAVRYLLCTDISLTDIAARLGYSELAVLSRSCQRWFASSPTALRRELTLTDPIDIGRSDQPHRRALKCSVAGGDVAAFRRAQR